jgi:hypothetical protein
MDSSNLSSNWLIDCRPWSYARLRPSPIHPSGIAMKSFEDYLRKKRIDLVQWQAEAPQEVAGLRAEYDAMGEASFDQRKKFWINRWRLRYHLAEPAKG